jgi:lysophospholipase L1-like esterase
MMKQGLLKVSLLGLSTLLSLLIVEGLLRIISPANPFSVYFPLYPHSQFKIHCSYPGVSPVAMHSTNRWGFRGDEPPTDWNQALTIITVGGSTTHCFFLDDHKTWPYLLQEDLKSQFPKVWVGNAGVDGQTTRAHLLMMREILSKIKPKRVIFLIGINDLGLSIREDRKTLGIPADHPHSRRWWLYTHSRLAQMLYDWYLVATRRVPEVESTTKVNFPPLVDAMHLPDNLNSLLPLLSEYRNNIRQLAQLSREYQIKPLFLTQPMLFDDTPPWRAVEGTFYWIARTKGKMSAATYWKLLNIYNHALLETCQSAQVDCFDLASAIPHNRVYFVDSVHFTEKGAALVAQKVADYLKTQRSLLS